jgi:hypothetical protein
MKHANKDAFISSVVASYTTVDIDLLYENDEFMAELKKIKDLDLDKSIEHLMEWVNSNY